MKCLSPKKDNLVEKWAFATEQFLDFACEKWAVMYMKEGSVYVTSPRQKKWYIPAGKMFFIPPNLPVHICGKKTGNLIICRMEGIDEVTVSTTPSGIGHKEIIMLYVDRSIRYFFPDFLMNYDCGLKCRMYVESKLDELLFLIRHCNSYLTTH
ncbi:MAG: hypothetical protein LBO74_06300 [Candidatus Symbiothrix sp.]|nr:hypothetical protein [Candidatus Symbiothrix sp.]